jgi:hypothetical protein
MLIIFSKHALLKLEQRKISKQFVLDTINKPELVRLSYGFKEELYRKFTRNYLKVVIKKTKINIIVVTVHWVAKIDNKL